LKGRENYTLLPLKLPMENPEEEEGRVPERRDVYKLCMIGRVKEENKKRQRNTLTVRSTGMARRTA